MAAVHGKNAFISVEGNDLSEFCNNIQMPREADSHDVTTFGNSAHRYVGGLVDGTLTLQGIYDSTAGGPQDVLEPLLGTTCTIVRSEERRVGKECRCRRWTHHEKRKVKDTDTRSG